MKKTFKVTGQNNLGEWLVKRPDGLMCSGTWKSKESAQQSCDTWNTRKSSWAVY